MRQLRFVAAFAVAALCACVTTFGRSAPRAYYLTQTPHTYSDSVADSVTIHMDDRTQLWLDSILMLGRKEQLEQAACLRIAKADRQGIWVDSVEDATVVPGGTTTYQIIFHCPGNTVPIHWHVVEGWATQCQPSSADTAPGWSHFPALLLQCGRGIDSVIAFRARKR